DTGYYHAKMQQKPHGTYTFKKSSHTGTELMIMMSVLGKGTITIENAAQEPEIDDLINFLNESGANIKRSGTSILVEGVKELKQTKPYTIASDRVEAVTYAVAGLATKGDVTITCITEDAIASFIKILKESGAGVEQVSEDSWRFFYKEMQPMHIETSPHPGFLTDWQPLMAVLMTQVNGKSTIHERIFENRFSYVKELQKLGAEVEYKTTQIENPSEYYFFNYEEGKKYSQLIEITGPQHLHSGIMTVADLRAGATLAIAALIAEGESYVRGIEHLQRGYEGFEEKIQKLGGEIRKI
ncbi:MAG TPA: UDP-N-acetylglucosamine 1-carboxyvinyltransferase, partial [Candidatus Woesebacteria bacterium]|nr:UDP-N-acetylglucosamine 1-carboxyvinyltransferase [Candidatus Woesebacteria bacterium]